MEPSQNLVNPLSVGKFSVELQIVSGTNSLDVRLRTDPKETSRPHALLLRQHPEWSSTIPSAVADCHGITIAIDLFPSRIIKAVGHDAMMFRVKAGNDGVMVGKGYRRISGKHTFRRAGALSCQCQQVVSMITLCIVIAEAVQRNEDDIGFRKLPRSIRPVINGNDGRNDGRDALAVGRRCEPTGRKYEAEDANGNPLEENMHVESPGCLSENTKIIHRESSSP